MNNKLQTNKIRKIINNNVILDDLSISKIEFQLQQLEYVVKENQQLKDRIDKAVELVEKNMHFYSGLQNEDLEIGLFEDEINVLLEILKGED